MHSFKLEFCYGTCGCKKCDQCYLFLAHAASDKCSIPSAHPDKIVLEILASHCPTQFSMVDFWVAISNNICWWIKFVVLHCDDVIVALGFMNAVSNSPHFPILSCRSLYSYCTLVIIFTVTLFVLTATIL